jgi:hypothetical protein
MRNRPLSRLIASKVCDGWRTLKDIVGGSRVTVLKDDTAMPSGMSSCGCGAAAVSTTIGCGTLRMRERTECRSPSVWTGSSLGVVDSAFSVCGPLCCWCFPFGRRAPKVSLATSPISPLLHSPPGMGAIASASSVRCTGICSAAWPLALVVVKLLGEAMRKELCLKSRRGGVHCGRQSVRISHYHRR